MMECVVNVSESENQYQERETESRGFGREQTLDRKRVLIVEDKPQAARLFKLAFRELDKSISVETVTDGEQAVERLQQRENGVSEPLPDLVILDLDLPKLNGIQVLRRVREDDRHADLPIVICSQHSGQETIDACHDLGVSAYFVKPPDYDGLVSIARQVGAFWPDGEIQCSRQPTTPSPVSLGNP